MLKHARMRVTMRHQLSLSPLTSQQVHQDSDQQMHHSVMDPTLLVEHLLGRHGSLSLAYLPVVYQQ
jgi:hypothetical protein